MLQAHESIEMAEIKVLHLARTLYKRQCVTTAQDTRLEMQSITFVEIKKCYAWSTVSIQARHKCKLWDKATVFET